MVLIFLADVCKWLDAYREAGGEPRAPGAGDVMLAASDAAIAAQGALLLLSPKLFVGMYRRVMP